MTENQQTGYFAKLWQLLPEALKKTLRTIRAQWHGDLYDEFQRVDEALTKTRDTKTSSSDLIQEISRQLAAGGSGQELSKRVEALFELMAATLKQVNKQSAAHMDTMAEWHRANLCNQISLANRAPGLRTIYTPWHRRKNLYINMGQDGRLWFYPNAQPDSNQPKIFTSTTPKSGTHFLGAVLQSLGFKASGVFCGDGGYADWRGLAADTQVNNPAALYAGLPFTVQMDLIQPGQYVMAHLGYETVMQARQQGLEKILLVVRDLRYTSVSVFRHASRTSIDFPALSNFSGRDLYRRGQ